MHIIYVSGSYTPFRLQATLSLQVAGGWWLGRSWVFPVLVTLTSGAERRRITLTAPFFILAAAPHLHKVKQFINFVALLHIRQGRTGTQFQTRKSSTHTGHPMHPNKFRNHGQPNFLMKDDGRKDLFATP